MKTSKSLLRKVTTAITGVIVLVTTSLTFTSCKKTEVLHPGKPEIATVSAKQISLIPRLVFKSIKIDHYAAGTRMQDYSISLNANGTASYEGRSNVRTHGTHTLEVSASQLLKINSLCIQFIEISKPDLTAQSDARLMAIPMVVTTYTSPDKSSNRLFMDYNNGQPVWLVMFRTQVEQVLEISKLTDAVVESAQGQEAE